MARRRSLCAKVRACRKGKKGRCRYGRNKNTGRCLKNKRAKR